MRIRIQNLRFAYFLCAAQVVSSAACAIISRPLTACAYASNTTAKPQTHSPFRTNSAAKVRRRQACDGTSIAYQESVNEDCGSPDCFSHCWLKLRDRLKPPSRKLGAVGAMPDGSHIPVSDRTRSENRMVNDATLHRAQTKYFRKRFGDQNRSSGIRTRSHLSASPTVIAHLSAEQGES